MHSLFGLIGFKFLQTRFSHDCKLSTGQQTWEGKKHVNLLQTGMNKVRGHNHYFFFFFRFYNTHNWSKTTILSPRCAIRVMGKKVKTWIRTENLKKVNFIINFVHLRVFNYHKYLIYSIGLLICCRILLLLL